MGTSTTSLELKATQAYTAKTSAASRSPLHASAQMLQRMGDEANLRLLVLQHILPDTVAFLQLARAASFDIPTVFAKPFSIHEPSLATLSEDGFNVIAMSYQEMESSDVLDRHIRREHARAIKQEQVLACIDVGGYFAGPMQRLASSNLPNFIGAVEVTTFGHNRYADTVEHLAQPVISLARSPLKNAEAMIVGDSAVVATDMILRQQGVMFRGSEVGVLGFGSIGQATARALRAKGHLVSVLDSNPIKLMAAKLEGFGVYGSKTELLINSDYVFAATASRAIDACDYHHFRDELTLVSVGSKANEFDVEGLLGAADQYTLEADGLSTLYFPNGKTARIVRMGKAVNFHIQSCPDQVMDLVFAETLSCLRRLQTGLQPGHLHEPTCAQQQLTAELWLSQFFPRPRAA